MSVKNFKKSFFIIKSFYIFAYVKPYKVTRKHRVAENYNTIMSKSKITILIEDKTRKTFKSVCAEEDVTMGSVIEYMMKLYIKTKKSRKNER